MYDTRQLQLPTASTAAAHTVRVTAPGAAEFTATTSLFSAIAASKRLIEGVACEAKDFARSALLADAAAERLRQQDEGGVEAHHHQVAPMADLNQIRLRRVSADDQASAAASASAVSRTSTSRQVAALHSVHSWGQLGGATPIIMPSPWRSSLPAVASRMQQQSRSHLPGVSVPNRNGATEEAVLGDKGFGKGGDAMWLWNQVGDPLDFLLVDRCEPL